MGQKVNPISNRLGIIRGWDSNWFGGKDFGDNLVEDQKIRQYLNKRLEKANVSRIVIERTLKLVTITICTARPGIVIGKGGQDVDKLKEELKNLFKKEIQINIFDVKKPELDATIVAKNIASQIEHMMACRRGIKMAVANTMRAGAEGVKIQITGRLNGAEMARKEMFKEGRTPLHTFRADIDYCQTEALTKVGLLGIKTLEAKWLDSRQIEAARVAVNRYMQREGQVWIRIFPDKPITRKPADVRMGKGKGDPAGWVAPVTPGRILFEVEGVSFDVAKEALRLAAQKLPVKTKFVIRRDYDQNA